MKLGHTERRPLWRRSRPERWPPYRLVEDQIADGAARRMERLERLYHVGQDQAWDGRRVLAELVARHGPPRLRPDRREPALKLLSVLLWGELAAWAISADLAERIDDVDAKMAATSQAHDEARHFYVLRDYLAALGEPVPHLGGIGRALLVGILETGSLAHKLVGMQLLVESNALSIFHALVESGIEPVLADLLPYYEKDEARHVGLGTMYLPRLLRRLSTVEAARLSLFQIRCVGLLMTAGNLMRRDFEALGLQQRKMAAYTLRIQDEILREMRAGGAAAVEKSARNVSGVVNPTRGFGPRLLDFVHPRDGFAAASPLHRAALSAWARGAAAIDRALA
jgi:hypothetical protein